MCPLRLILVFVSGLLAGYLAWKSLRSEPSSPLKDNHCDFDVDDVDSSGVPTQEDESSSHKFSVLSKVVAAIVSAFWMFVDMASGKFLWQNLTSSNAHKCKNV